MSDRERSHGRNQRWLKGTLMARLTENTGRELLELAPPKLYGAGTALLNQGDCSTHVFLIEAATAHNAACVKVTARLKNGDEALLGIRGSGDVVGELGALRNTARNATVTACTPVFAHAIGRESFLGFLHKHDEAWQLVCTMIADRLDWANRRRLDFAGYDVPVRLARVLLELVAQHGVRNDHGYEPGVQLSQVELGRLVGARPDTVSSAMRQLKSLGLIAQKYRSVTITDLDGLRAYADPA